MRAFKVGIGLLGAFFSLQVGCAGSGMKNDGEGGPVAGSGGAGTGNGGSAQGGSAGSGGKQQGGNPEDGGESGQGGGGGAGPIRTASLQLNDVSLLFPLPATEDELASGLLAASAEGERGQLLSESLYDAVGAIAGSRGNGLLGSQPVAPYENLRIVALRLDPCFGSLEPPADGGGCQNQLRLITQEIDQNGAHDSALHLFYSVSRQALLGVLREIAQLREQYAPGRRLGKLAPHPLMLEQGLAGGMAEGVRRLVLAHAGVDNLTRITRMSAIGGPFWDFSGFDVKDGAAVSFAIPALNGGVVQTFERNFGDVESVEPRAAPPSASPDDFIRLMTVSTAKALNEAERTSSLTSLLRVENPAHHSPDTLDCVTCHVATPTLKLIVEPILNVELPNVPERFQTDGELVPATELEPTFENEQSFTNVHAFSYLGHNVGINQRTVNESAAVVVYLSRFAAP
jgi:hypothetical protein